MNRQGTGDCQGSETVLCDSVMVDTYHFTFAKTHRIYNTKVNPHVNYKTLINNNV